MSVEMTFSATAAPTAVELPIAKPLALASASPVSLAIISRFTLALSSSSGSTATLFPPAAVMFVPFPAKVRTEPVSAFTATDASSATSLFFAAASPCGFPLSSGSVPETLPVSTLRSASARISSVPVSRVRFEAIPASVVVSP